MEKNFSQTISDSIQDLLNTVIRQHNVSMDDVVSLKTMKLITVGLVMQEFNITWDFFLKRFNTHTPVHPKIAQELLKNADEDTICTFSQIFVKNKKLLNMVKKLNPNDMNKMLAVDGLAGVISKKPNFNKKLYIGNLRFANKGENKFIFDEESEFKRLHVQTVRQMYEMLKDVTAPTKYVYDILTKNILDVAGVQLPMLEFTEDERLNGELEYKIATMYMESMGRENLEKFVETLRIHQEKRSNVEDDTPSPKKTKTEDDE